MTTESITALFQTLNEILATSIVIIAFSMLLYNLTRDLHNRVARTSGLVLAAVTFPYICDVFLSLQPDTLVSLTVVRLQWIGISFVPATLFHLSDALLETTGLPSRGRRKRILRILYLLSAAFLIAATFSNSIIQPIATGTTITIEAGSFTFLFIIYFISMAIVTFINMQRARQRSLTRTTRRRMGYLQYAILLPALGVFPFSIFINSTDEHSLPITLLVIIANIVVMGMLIFLSYPLSFFGSDKPDRVVKVELLHFLLRGPGTALLALTAIVVTSRATRVLGLDNEDFLPFAVVAVVLMWQWSIALLMPQLERILIYGGDDDEQLNQLLTLNERILTRNDLLQYSEATLEALCDVLRVPVAFLLAVNGKELEIIQTVGSDDITIALNEHENTLQETLAHVNGKRAFYAWQDYQLLVLRSQRMGDDNPIIGVLGVQATANTIEITSQESLRGYINRAEQTLQDLRLQSEIFASLEGLLPQIVTTRQQVDDIEFRPAQLALADDIAQDREELYEQMRAALRHYWGGPGIARSRLIDLKIVQTNIKPGESPTHALRQIIQVGVEKQRPEGERSYTAPEWTIYNILMLRFLEAKKVRDVARRMSMSEADLYRKQRLAIETLAETILDMNDALPLNGS